MNLFEPNHINGEIDHGFQLFVQHQGSSTEGPMKKRMLGKVALLEAQKIIDKGGWVYVSCEDTVYQKPLKQIIQTIRGSDLVISVDSFAKTVSAMSRIKTIVYDNLYDPEYLKQFRNGIDYGHYVFILPWSYIEFRKQ
jgi:hypothetical protein